VFVGIDLGRAKSFVAAISPTGKGEKAMPTTQIVKAFLKAKHRRGERTKLMVINEFRTTLCCCACGGTTEAKMKQSGQRSSRLRLCTQCNESTAKLRDRDVQAARNCCFILPSPTTLRNRLYKSLFVHLRVFQIKLYEVYKMMFVQTNQFFNLIYL
jgi:hypothetical protein